MNKIVKEEPVFEKVQTRTEPKTYYTTFDGKEFDSEEKAEDYESHQTAVNKNKELITSLNAHELHLDSYGIGFFITVEHPLFLSMKGLLAKLLGLKYYAYAYLNEDIDLAHNIIEKGYYFFTITDGGDHRGTVDVYSMDYIKSRLELDLIKLNNNIKERSKNDS